MTIRQLIAGASLTLAGLIGGAGGAVTPTIAPTTGPVKAVELSPQQAQFFETKVRPIFTSKCYKCHSMEQGKSKGDLVLDSREGWQKGGENGAAIVPGDPGKSLVIKAISYSDPDLQMPPKGEKLSAQEIADLTEWVKMGAPDPRAAGPGIVKLNGMNDKAKAHWAYQPVQLPEVPQVKQKAWVKTPVDNFILAKLEANDMVPTHASPRAALLRRATYDLIGLPPTPQELRQFIIDPSPNAFEKVVDRLLASPHYGERWGRFWLDTARYSDTTGDKKENQKEDYRYADAWTYRDYVIKAFNDDKPYDQFLKEQIAADLLPNADKNPDTLAALGFLTVGKRFPDRNDTIDERIDTLCKATMALTVSCARCHDHKFDPIPTADYYSLHGVFSSISEPQELPVIGKPPTAAQVADYHKKLVELEQKNKDVYYEIVKEKTATFRAKASAYLQTALIARDERADNIAMKRKLIGDNNLSPDMVRFLNLRRLDQAFFGPLLRFAQIPEDGFEKKAQDVVDSIAKSGDKGRVNMRVAEAFSAVKPGSLKSIKDVTEVYQKLLAGLDQKSEAYINGQKSSTSSDTAAVDDQTQLLIAPFTKVEPSGALTTAHLKEATNQLALGNNPLNRFYFGAINELELMNPGSPARAMVVVDARPTDSPIFIHGDPKNRGAIVPRRFLQILSGADRQPFKSGSGRLELAQGIGSKNNPLTARVLVNRVWMHHFGEGFVRTPDDMGVQSEPPSHPELLNYLAYHFMEDASTSSPEGMGWSIKKLHKTIMLSSAYQQSSDTNNVFAKKDPDNHLVWRANLRRLDFEAIRDSLLMFTGKMDQTIGGRPVNLSDEPYSYRRSVYGYVDRGRLPELMAEFDFSDPNRANSKRTTTIVPQQALFFMNSPMSADVARKVVTRPEFASARTDDERVKALYIELFQREPYATEYRLAGDFFRAHAMYDSKNMAANKLKTMPSKSVGNKKTDEMGPGGDAKAIQNEGEIIERGRLNLWEQYAQALLFSNEIAYVN